MVIDFGAICEKSSTLTPYETICQLMSRDGSVQTQSGLYQTMTPFFNRQFNMYLNGTCVSLCAPFMECIITSNSQFDTKNVIVKQK